MEYKDLDFNQARVFIDKRNRKIEITVSDDLTSDGIVAKHNDKEIGHFEFDDREGHTMLYSMNINDEYQRAGIGSEMFKMLSAITDDFIMPSRRWYQPSDPVHLSTEGAGFLNYCFDTGILDEKNEFFERHEP